MRYNNLPKGIYECSTPIPLEKIYKRILICDCTMGILWRENFRRGLMKYNISYKEEKGWLDSLFIMEDEESKIMAFVEEWETMQAIRKERLERQLKKKWWENDCYS